jgi:gluconolactonase
MLYTEAEGAPIESPNDIVFDETGNFWFTDFRGPVFYAAPDGSSITRAVTGLAQPNGIGLSPDGTILILGADFHQAGSAAPAEGPRVIVPSIGPSIASIVIAGGVDAWSVLVGMPGFQEFDSLAVDSSGARIRLPVVVSGGSAAR